MDEINFRNWLIENKKTKKVVSDISSRLRRVEIEVNNCDIDEQYQKDKCKYLLSLFKKMGKNDNLKKYNDINLPVGRYYMSTYSYAIKLYIKFIEDFNAKEK